jgi:hypothetical protein
MRPHAIFFPIRLNPPYHAHMKKLTGSKSRRPSVTTIPQTPKRSIPRPSREFVHSLRGKYRGEGLLKSLMQEKKPERDL